MTPSAYSNRIKNLRNLAQKLAFSPAGAMPPPDPAMAGGMPPMDPAMAGGAPPMDPAMAGGMPPMDPAMAGGMPPQGGMPPMDPAMAGGMPPMDPAAMGGDPAAMQQQSPEMGELMDMVQAMGYMLTQICKKLDIQINPDEQKQDAEEAMLGGDEQASLDAQQAADAELQNPMTQQAEEAVDESKPGYIQDKIGQFEQA